MSNISRTESQITVIPPGNAQLLMGMHWLEIRYFGSDSFGCIALQWNPGSKSWTHSNAHDTYGGHPIDTSGWRYIKAIPHPEIGE